MIRLGGLVSQKAFGKFEMGKVISNPFANAFIKEGDGEDHEVSMANNSIDTIIKMATELKAKMGEDEKQIPAWIQDHIAKAENLISQASGNYHEYGDSNESVVKENILNEDLDALGLLIPALGALIGGGLAQLYPYFTGRPNIYTNIKDWWNSKKDNSEMNKIANRIKNDPDVQEFLKKKNKSGWKEMLKKKLTGSELNYLNKIYRSRFNNESVNEAPAKLKQTISKKEWSKIPKYNKHIGMDGVHYIMKYDDKIGTYLQGVQIVDESIKEDSPCWKGYKQVGMKDKGGRQVPNCVPNESVVNEAPNTGERIQNLNNRIKVLRDKISATKSPEQKKLFSDRLKNALQSLSNIKKDHSIKAPHRESVVKEAVAPKDMDKIKSAVEAASSFMGVGSELKKLGMKYTFATEPLAIYIVQPTPNNKVAIVNKRYVSKPDFVVGDIAVGVMEGVNEISSKTPKIFVKTAAVEKKIRELMDDRKKAVVPYNSEKDPKKKEILKQILIKLTKQIQGYEKNLIQLRDMEEEYLQQMHADAELDTTGL